MDHVPANSVGLKQNFSNNK